LHTVHYVNYTIVTENSDIVAVFGDPMATIVASVVCVDEA